MTKIVVSVKRDHIETLASTKRPVVSLADLVWNSLDADADTVTVRLGLNALGAIDRIRVADAGIA
jgi:DNA mismatch repair ATPase MutL